MKIKLGLPSLFMNHQLNLRGVEKLFFRDNEYLAKPNMHMFNEDVQLGIFSHRSEREQQLEIETNNSDLTETLLSAMKRREGWRENLEDKIVAISRDIVSDLLQYKKCIFCAYLEADDTFRIMRIDPRFVGKVLGFNFQYLPIRKTYRPEDGDGYSPREIRFFNNNQIMHFSLPSNAIKSLRLQNHFLAEKDKQSFSAPLKFMPNAENETFSFRDDFNFSLWHQQSEKLLDIASRSTGWSGRNRFHPLKTDFFTCTRLLRFKTLQVHIRDHVLSSISSNLTKIGKMNDQYYDLQISASQNIPSLAQLRNIQGKLKAEQICFSKVIDIAFENNGWEKIFENEDC